MTERKTKLDWAEFLKEIEEKYKDAKKIKLGMDNLNTHKASSLCEKYLPKEAKSIWDRFEFIYTPKHGSWLNMVEIELYILNAQCLNRRIGSIDEVKEEVEAWQNHRNNKCAKINWRFTTKESRIKLKRLYPLIDT